jgi:hypothetical protein
LDRQVHAAGSSASFARELNRGVGHDTVNRAQLRVPELLLIGGGARAVRWTAELARQGNIVSADTLGGAETFLRERPLDLIVTVYAVRENTAVDVCRLAATVSSPPSVLVIQVDAVHAPRLIDAGCEGILLKPVSANDLCGRVRRLLRDRRARTAVLASGRQERSHAPYRTDDSSPPASRGSIQYCANTVCRQCTTAAVYSFAAARHGRNWYSCLACQRVWVGLRQAETRRMQTPSTQGGR